MPNFYRLHLSAITSLLALVSGAAADPVGEGPCARFDGLAVERLQGGTIWEEVTQAFKERCYKESLQLALALREFETAAPEVRTFSYLILNHNRLGNQQAVRQVIEDANQIFGPYVPENECDPRKTCWSVEARFDVTDDHTLEPPVLTIARDLVGYGYASDVPAEGSCDVRFNVDVDGRPHILETTCTHPAFKGNAENAILTTEFPQKIIRGQPVERRNLVYPLKFKLGPDGSEE